MGVGLGVGVNSRDGVGVAVAITPRSPSHGNAIVSVGSRQIARITQIFVL